MTDVTRAAFFGRGARGGLTLVAGGSLLAAASGTAFAAGNGDAAVAKLAATAELLAIDFYGRAIASKRFSGDEAAYLEAARANEQDHYHALAGVLGKAAPKGLHFQYPAGSFGSRLRTAKLAMALETAFVGAYMGAVKSLSSNDLKQVAAQIGANENRHLAIFTNIASGGIVAGESFPKAFSAAQATKAVTPFLTGS